MVRGPTVVVSSCNLSSINSMVVEKSNKNAFPVQLMTEASYLLMPPAEYDEYMFPLRLISIFTINKINLYLMSDKSTSLS